MNTVGERVRKLREDKRIARKDLARDAGMSYSGLSDLESGKAKSTTKLHRLAALLGVEATYLETGKHHSGVRDAAAPYGVEPTIEPEIVFDVARALQEAHEELGLTYDFTDNPQLFIDAYQRAATFGNFSEGRGSAWLGSAITKNATQETPRDERTKGTHVEGVHTTKPRGAARKG